MPKGRQSERGSGSRTKRCVSADRRDDAEFAGLEACEEPTGCDAGDHCVVQEQKCRRARPKNCHPRRRHKDEEARLCEKHGSDLVGTPEKAVDAGRHFVTHCRAPGAYRRSLCADKDLKDDGLGSDPAEAAATLAEVESAAVTLTPSATIDGLNCFLSAPGGVEGFEGLFLSRRSTVRFLAL